jgi:Right handed beta helix region
MSIKSHVKIATIVFIVVALSQTIKAHSAWYVDKDAAGSNDGTSWDNAWKSFAAIQTEPGGTVYISGGSTSKTYTEELIVSGGATFKAGALSPSPEGHSGTVIIDQTGKSDVISVRGDNITIDGWSDGVQKIKVVGATRGIDTGYHENIVLKGIEFTEQTDKGIFFADSSGEMAHIYVHGGKSVGGKEYDAGIFFGSTIAYPVFDRIIIHDSEIAVPKCTQNNGQGADAIQASGAATIYNNKLSAYFDATYPCADAQHGDAIQPGGRTHFKIYNNEIHGFSSYGFYMEFANQHVYIYNNYFWDTRGAIILGNNIPAYDDFRIENNTIVDCLDVKSGAPTPPISFDPPTSTTATNFYIRNNIVVNCNGGILSTLACPGQVVVDYNVIAAGAGGSSNLRCAGNTYIQPNYGSTKVPTFVSYVAGGGATNNVHVVSGDMVAKNRGVVGFFNYDKDDVSRPQETAWDIGAYEFAGRIPRPPEIISVQ